ncbi:aldehyde dehydrogenase family protein [Salipiger pacificus]|nr:aldehyde dehydrogenase family protein [Alloyangia pacifica]
MSENLPRVTYTDNPADMTPLHLHLDNVLEGLDDTYLGKEFGHFINGEWVAGSKHYEVYSPADSARFMGTFSDATEAEIDQAVTAARAAFGEWRTASWQQRVAAMRKVADVLEERRHELGMIILHEVGKSRMEAMGEAEEVLAFIRYYCDTVEENQGYAHPNLQLSSSESTFNCFRPHGVFAVVSPFNFPVGLATSMLTGAILGGNAVVLKPSQANARSVLFFAEAAQAAGLPQGLLNVVTGGAEAGEALVSHAGIDGIAFTGSRRVGMKLHRDVANGPYVRPVIAELGGKNSSFVTKSANLADAAKGVASAAFGLQGQKCTACSRVFVEKSVAKEFVELLQREAAGMTIGHPTDKTAYLGPVIDERAGQRYLEAVAEAEKVGTVAFGGKRKTGGIFDRGWYLEPTIVTGVPFDHWLNQEELFVPFLSVVECDDLASAVEASNRSPYGLGSGVYTRDQAELDYFLNHIEAGVLYANRSSSATTGAWPGAQSFCGWKGSGHTGKGGMGPNYITQFMREQSHTLAKIEML